ANMQRFAPRALRLAPLALKSTARGPIRCFAGGPQDVLDKYAALNAGKGERPTTVSAASGSNQDILGRLQNFQDEVTSANWADYLLLVYNVPFWEAQYEALLASAGPYAKPGSPVAVKLEDMKEMMDVLYQCEDVRDHVNELCELATRASGFMGTG
ncbi:unnamed protein product, partial [Polarella glacialis]